MAICKLSAIDFWNSPDSCNLWRGSCVADQFDNKVCNDKEGFLGEECQFESNQICDTIEFDHRFDPFSTQKYDSPSRLDVVKDSDGSHLLHRNKAAYYYVFPLDSELSEFMNIVIFFGRRYYFMAIEWTEVFPGETADSVASAFVTYVQQEMPIPAELSLNLASTDYYGTRLGIGVSTSTQLVCTTCQYCELFGTCNEDMSSYDCDEGFVGPRCEYYDSFVMVNNRLA